MPRPRPRETIIALIALGLASSALAHPAPFTYLDVRIEPSALELTLVAHVFDIGHDLNVDPPELLLQESTLRTKAPQFAALIGERLSMTVDGRPVALEPWGGAEALADRQSVRVHSRAPLGGSPGVVAVNVLLFPYDPIHQTFINFYEGDQVTAQAIRDAGHTSFTYFAGTLRGTWAAISLEGTDGMVHVFTGWDHLLFLLGLLVTGSSRRQQILIASVFTAGQLATVTLALLNVLSPPSRLIDPAIALTIVYVGIDNLMVQGGRDVRIWMSLAFGAIHGFSVAALLRSMGLAPRALYWSVAAFNVGVELGLVAAAMAIASALSALRSRDERLARRLAFAGSWVLIAAGTLWFVQRVFFPGVMA